jgi:hypothetical protein
LKIRECGPFTFKVAVKGWIVARRKNRFKLRLKEGRKNHAYVKVRSKKP